jgi:urea transport system permease protein
LTNFTTLAGVSLERPSTQRLNYLATAVSLIGALMLSRQLVRSRFGRLLVAVRDGEERARFLGYDPAICKTAAFAFSAALGAVLVSYAKTAFSEALPSALLYLQGGLLVLLLVVAAPRGLAGVVELRRSSGRWSRRSLPEPAAELAREAG